MDRLSGTVSLSDGRRVSTFCSTRSNTPRRRCAGRRFPVAELGTSSRTCHSGFATKQLAQSKRRHSDVQTAQGSRMGEQPMKPWSVSMAPAQWAALYPHLFPGDHAEHGAILRCGLVETATGTRLLVKHVSLAVDGTDYVVGADGHSRLTEEFILENINECDEQQLAYLAVHCHGGTTSVGFSKTDFRSHERGYPALIGITRGMPVGALVFSERAVAGDIWLKGGARVRLDHLSVVGRPRVVLREKPERIGAALGVYDRQSRLFGDRGQEILQRQKVAVVGLGGCGSLISQLLARLGVGELLLIDSDRVEDTNLPRIVGARRHDALPWLSDDARPAWVGRFAARLRTPKVKVAARVAREASQHIKITAVVANVDDPHVAAMLADCDQIFLSADSAIARNVVNALSHQYLIPFTEVGAKVTTNQAGEIQAIFSVSRSSTPGQGCLWCNGVLDQNKLRDELTPIEQLKRQKYVDDDEVHAPSVITLNATATAIAVNDWMMCVTGLVASGGDTSWIEIDAQTQEQHAELPFQDPLCRECGPRRFAVGDGLALPVRLTVASSPVKGLRSSKNVQ